ncbi:MAG: NUDIX domain-containing protein [Patescibacteria group bacterium]|nr:NUDIX domain-containing protein [Patescibacteria group bacterium]
MPINQCPNIHELVVCANFFVRKNNKYLLIKRSSKKTFAPNVMHPIGGKIDANENPFFGAQRELFEEAGIKVKNIKLEAVILEIAPHKEIMANNWLIFHFSGDYDSGELKTSEEGKFIWLTSEEIKQQELFPSVQQTIDYILNPSDGTVFATFEYDENHKIIERTKKIDKCVV